MPLTPQQAQYFSLQLTRRRASDDSEKLSSALLDAKVDLNPHQVDAALFAFKSPLSNGAILADEVGLGKTIEAGILLSQFWASGKKKLLIIGPSNLRRQWAQELEDKFYLSSVIMDSKRFKELHAEAKHNPLDQNKVIICSFHFAKAKADYINLVKWDLVVIDEAHRLRNVYRPSNKIGKAIKAAIDPFKKVLLTATPLQNSLMELYGLTSIVDEHVFGNVESFRAQFTRNDDGVDYKELKERIRPLLHRTLRRQVREHVPWTERIPITIQFHPTEEEQELYDRVTEYLHQDLLYAMPDGKRHLVTMILHKLLASSSFAVTRTLEKLIKGLEYLLEEKAPSEDFMAALFADMDGLDDVEDEWEEDEEESRSAAGGEEHEKKKKSEHLSAEEIEAVKAELKQLKSFRELSVSITHNAKGDKLFTALEQGFEQLKKIGANKKVIIFTESRRTQEYLFDLLENAGYSNKVMLFNGSNTDARSKEIYNAFKKKYEGTDKLSGSKTADVRQALVDHFKNSAEVMIATEAAAEGINLQFCSMVINYDLPWNPQRIEQRIGRCHRYGQKHDVVVVNFQNLDNAADRRVLDLLTQKFNLFSGVFGASDEVLGTLESGVDFERKIIAIIQRCRTNEQINAAFDALQKEYETVIDERMRNAQMALTEHFDADVIEKLRTRMEESTVMISKFQRWLWEVSRTFLRDDAQFDIPKLTFQLLKNPFKANIHTGLYTLDKKNEQAYRYRVNHPLAAGILKHYANLELAPEHVTFHYSSGPQNNALISPFKGQSGWLRLSMVEVNSLEQTDHLVFTGYTDSGTTLQQEQVAKLMELQADATAQQEEPPEQQLEKVKRDILKGYRENLKNNDAKHLQQEVNKLNRWAEDRILLLEKEIHDTKKRIQVLNRDSAKTIEPIEQLKIQKKIQAEEKKQRKQRQQIFAAEDRIQDQRTAMIDTITKRIDRSFREKQIFTVRWTLN